LDAQLSKLINPQTTGFQQAWQPLSPSQLLDQYISGTQIEQENPSQQ
jgi:hypothetical protein